MHNNNKYNCFSVQSNTIRIRILKVVKKIKAEIWFSLPGQPDAKRRSEDWLKDKLQLAEEGSEALAPLPISRRGEKERNCFLDVPMKLGTQSSHEFGQLSEVPSNDVE